MSRLSQSRFHFIGIGGIGMSGLAELLNNMGAKVTGSDLNQNAQVQRLMSLGIEINIGHSESNVKSPDVVVYSSAVKSDNPEIIAAKSQKVPIIRRAEALAEIMRLKRGIAVGGTHGKTTTTSMLASVFLHSQWSPTIVVGGRLDLIKSTSLLGQGEWLIAEADESDGSFELLSPEIAIVTNIDRDHMDHFKSFDILKQAFKEFGESVPFYGAVVTCGDDPIAREVFSDFPKKVIFYGFNEGNDIRLIKSDGRYSVERSGIEIGQFQLQVPGNHNALNATAAIAAALEAGITPENAFRGLELFGGVDRRFHFKGTAGETRIYDDYGHHPTEVVATLQGFREKYPDKKIHVLFQPHRYSRTEACWTDFLNCFEDCDHLIITDIYAAGESPIENITSQRLVDECQHNNSHFIGRGSNFVESIRESLKSADVFVTLGAGDIWKVGEELLEKKV